MKTKEPYTKPDIEIITLDTQNDIMAGSIDTNEVDTYKGGGAGAKERSFWD